jgi:hypothetical protein
MIRLRRAIVPGLAEQRGGIQSAAMIGDEYGGSGISDHVWSFDVISSPAKHPY